jgi:hypothetical protein
MEDFFEAPKLLSTYFIKLFKTFSDIHSHAGSRPRPSNHQFIVINRAEIILTLAYSQSLSMFWTSEVQTIISFI